MDVHEYQAKALLATGGVPIPAGRLAATAEEAGAAALEVGGCRWVVKAQVHAGGRGKAGGIVLCDSVRAVRAAAQQLLGSTLFTPQTGPLGRLVGRVYVEEALPFSRLLYLALVLDRRSEAITVLASANGGVEIEVLAQDKPQAIRRLTVDPWVGLHGFEARSLGYALGLTGADARTFAGVLQCAYALFRERDATLLEINPLAVVPEHGLVALDAKMTFDDNALYRQRSVSELRDPFEEDPREALAAQGGLNYVGLSGEIGCVINGAGLAMATMDLIKLAGGEPANFLDVGGGASPQRIGSAFDLVLTDPNVTVILVNIFAGINRCDWVAEGVVQAARDLTVPVVVRLSGTNEQEGRQIIRDCGLPIFCVDTLEEAAHKAVEVARAQADAPAVREGRKRAGWPPTRGASSQEVTA